MNKVAPLAHHDFVHHAQRWLQLHEQIDSRLFAHNINATLSAIKSNDYHLPVTITTNCNKASWVCSPYTAYVHYAIEEIDRFGSRWLTWPLQIICRGLGVLVRSAQIDRAITINNWLLSTNLYPAVEHCFFADTIAENCQRFPDHAIWFRSLNGKQNDAHLQALKQLGCVLVPSRQVYFFDFSNVVNRVPVSIRRDRRLRTKTPYRRVGNDGITEADYARIAQLYAQLYLEKYSELNPAYTAKLMREWHHHELLHFVGYRDETGELQAIVGLFAIGTTVTAPIVGYNTALPQKDGLYRLLMIEAIESSRAAGYSLNLSAGAANFKRIRGGEAVIEYSAVYIKHLPWFRRAAVHLLASLCRGIGVPIMKIFRL